MIRFRRLTPALLNAWLVPSFDLFSVTILVMEVSFNKHLLY
jgi:hypothetical protein